MSSTQMSVLLDNVMVIPLQSISSDIAVLLSFRQTGETVLNLYRWLKNNFK
jgi:hypothetical protein